MRRDFYCFRSLRHKSCKVLMRRSSFAHKYLSLRCSRKTNKHKITRLVSLTNSNISSILARLFLVFHFDFSYFSSENIFLLCDFLVSSLLKTFTISGLKVHWRNENSLENPLLSVTACKVFSASFSPLESMNSKFPFRWSYCRNNKKLIFNVVLVS